MCWFEQHYFSICCRGAASTALRCDTFKKTHEKVFQSISYLFWNMCLLNFPSGRIDDSKTFLAFSKASWIILLAMFSLPLLENLPLHMTCAKKLKIGVNMLEGIEFKKISLSSLMILRNLHHIVYLTLCLSSVPSDTGKKNLTDAAL